ncbi:MAG: thioredoxin family protein, partial [Ginsengibacter sp.]
AEQPMNKFLAIIISFSLYSFTGNTDFATALKNAKEKHQLILINFSGSDWCGPCIRMRKEIFDDDSFSKMGDTSLQFVNADFPRNKKNQLDKAIVKQNEILADKYNPNGLFPLTILINVEGLVIKSWDGLPKETAAQFTKEVKAICDGNR